MALYRNKKTGELATLYSEHKKSKTVILLLKKDNKGIAMTLPTFYKNWEEVKNG